MKTSSLRRVVYPFAFSCFILGLACFGGCDAQEKGACVSGTGIGRVCRDDVNEYGCEQLHGTLYPDTKCAELGFSRGTASRTTVDSSSDSCDCQKLVFLASMPPAAK